MGKMIRASIGSLGVLGLKRMKLPAPPTTLYLMVGEKCMYSCAYCPQSQSSFGDSYEKLSRVTWPQIEWSILKDSIVNKPDFVKRICFQVVNSPDYLDNIIFFLKDISTMKLSLPISVSVRPKDIDEVEAIFDAGAERVGIAMDCVSEKLFNAIRGGNFNSYLNLILDSSRKFAGRITTHIIVGLGETDREIYNAMKLFYDNHITVALFSFTPITETRLEQASPPSLARYRRIQFMRYLFNLGRAENMNFDFDKGGNLTSIATGMSQDENCAILSERSIYMTTGCPNCNRPYYNETPSGTMYNYPFVPSNTDKLQVAFVEKVEDGRIIFKK
ncbi:MAG: radical SAM protein [Caldisericaceae bacterium]